MTALVDIFGLVLMIAGAFCALAFAVQWTRVFADWLWLIPSAPKMTICVSLVAVILVAVVVRSISNIPLDRPLAFSIELAIVPFLAVYCANGIAFLRVKCWGKAEPAYAWHDFIFSSEREAQRESYEAPRNVPN